MVGVDLRQKATPYLKALMDKGVLALPAGATVVRFLPPLVITKEELISSPTASPRWPLVMDEVDSPAGHAGDLQPLRPGGEVGRATCGTAWPGLGFKAHVDEAGNAVGEIGRGQPRGRPPRPHRHRRGVHSRTPGGRPPLRARRRRRQGTDGHLHHGRRAGQTEGPAHRRRRRRRGGSRQLARRPLRRAGTPAAVRGHRRAQRLVGHHAGLQGTPLARLRPRAAGAPLGRAGQSGSRGGRGLLADA